MVKKVSQVQQNSLQNTHLGHGIELLDSFPLKSLESFGCCCLPCLVAIIAGNFGKAFGGQHIALGCSQ